jgi:Arc/MetJ family transcription regulator
MGTSTIRVMLVLDNELVAKAQAFTGLSEKSNLVRKVLKALIEWESVPRLARLGGSEPEIEFAPRRGSAGA